MNKDSDSPGATTAFETWRSEGKQSMDTGMIQRTKTRQKHGFTLESLDMIYTLGSELN